MKITSGFYSANYYKNINKTRNQENPVTGIKDINISNNRNVFAYRDCVSFGERLYRTPEDFYAQPFNQVNMPVTVRNYLNEDYEERQHMPPAQLQREAFQYLSIADSVDDVKSMYCSDDSAYGYEPLFEKLRPFSETRATRGTLFLLRWDAMTSKTPIFKDKNEKDLTVYLLKKVYLEGKTHEEINKDFEQDATDEIKKELGVKDGRYFSYADFLSLGVRYPNKSYYNSFLATRKDKEYIPRRRTVSENSVENAVKEQQTTEAKQSETTRVVSDETREKISIAKKKWWSEMTPEEKDSQIRKMVEGKEDSDSIYFKYQSAIMTIAADKAGFSDRLVSIISDKYSDEEFLSENETYSQKQSEIMLDFWNKDDTFKKLYSDAMNETIQDFEIAVNLDDGSGLLEELLNKATEIKKSIIERANERRLLKKAEQEKVKAEKETQDIDQDENSEKDKAGSVSQTPVQAPVEPKAVSYDLNSEKVINKLFRQMESLAMQFYPDMFKDAMMRYLMKNLSFEDKRVQVILNLEGATEQLGIPDETLELMQKRSLDQIEKINQNFNKEQRLIAVTNDFILNKFLFELLEMPQSFKNERGDFNQIVKEFYLEQRLRNAKSSLNREMKNLAVPMSEKNTKEFVQNDLPQYLNILLKNGFTKYGDLKESDVSKKVSSQIEYIQAMLKINPEFEKATISFFKNYNAPIKYIKGKCKNQEAKTTLIQKMIIEYIMFSYEYFESIKKKTAPSAVEIKKPEKLQEAFLRVGNAITDKELDETFFALSDKQMPIFSNDCKRALINYLLNHPDMEKFDKIAFILIESGMLDSRDASLPKEDEEAVRLYITNKFNKINKEFDSTNVLITKANEFAINETFYNMTQNPDVFKNTRADAVMSVFQEGMSNSLISSIKESVEEKYKIYAHPLTNEEAVSLYGNEFKHVLENVKKSGLTYHDDIKFEDVKTLLGYMSNMPEENIIDFIKNYRGLFEFIHKPNVSESLKMMLVEHILYDIMCELIPREIMAKRMVNGN